MHSYTFKYVVIMFYVCGGLVPLILAYPYVCVHVCVCKINENWLHCIAQGDQLSALQPPRGVG